MTDYPALFLKVVELVEQEIATGVEPEDALGELYGATISILRGACGSEWLACALERCAADERARLAQEKGDVH